MTTKMLQWRLHTFKMESGTLLQDHLDALQTAKIKKNEEMLASAFVIFTDFKIW